MTLLLTDSEDSKDFEDSSDFAFAATPSQLIKSLSPVGCTVPILVPDCVRSVPSALATIKGLKGRKGSTNHQKERPKRAKRPERH